jgi:hypothetical protein
LLSNVSAVAGTHSGSWPFHSGNYRQSITQRHEDEAIVPAETFAASHRLKKKKRKKIPFGECAGAGAKAKFAAAIVAVKGEMLLQPKACTGIACHSAPQNA